MQNKTDTMMARAFASADCTEQADFINHLGRELYAWCQHGQSNGFEMQCCYLSDKLDSAGIRLIKELHGFITLREEA